MEEEDMPVLLERMGTTKEEAHSLVKIDWSKEKVTLHEATVIAWMLRNEKLARVTSLRPLPRLEFASLPCTGFTWCVSLGSVDGSALPIDELKGKKPTKEIDLSREGLGVASAIIIASCIQENGVLNELKCAPRPELCSDLCQRPLTRKQTLCGNSLTLLPL